MSLCINPQCPKPDNSDTILFCEACGSELLLKGRYRAMCKLGEGGFGITYEVTKVGSTVPEVLKVLTYDEPKAIELFQQEAKVLSELDHPGIPKVEQDSYFVYHPRGSKVPIHCFVMEKIVGMDLRQYMEKRGQRPIDQKLAIDWLKEVVTILGKVHDKNFFHRDIKPPNIMIRSSGELVLIDFGTARKVTTTVLEQKGGVTQIVSEGYTPQEQIVGDAIPQSDFFALGRTFVALLTGKKPLDLYDSFHGEVRWRNHAPEISPLLANLIDEMMAHKPSQRPANTQVILQRLSEIESKLCQPKQTYPDPKPKIAVDPSAPTIRLNNSDRSTKNSKDLFLRLIIIVCAVLVSSAIIFISLYWGFFAFYIGWLNSILAIAMIGWLNFMIVGTMMGLILAICMYSVESKYSLFQVIGKGVSQAVIPLFVLSLIFATLIGFQSQFGNPPFNFLVHHYPSRSSIDVLLSFSFASIESGLMLTSYVAFVLHLLDEKKFNSYSVKHFVMANISFFFAIISMIVTISTCNLKFQSAIEYIAIVIEFFAVQAIFQYLVLKYSFSQTVWTFSTGSLATLIGYYISFNLLGELISSDIFKTIIGSSIFSIVCTLVYLIKSEKNGIKSILNGW
jgi:serine/threonine protein kinase